MEDIEAIELYLEGKLSDNDRILFEAKLQNNEHLLNELLNQKQLLDSLAQYREKQLLKQKLEKIHSSMFIDKKAVKENGFKVFWISHYKTMAVAASVSLLVAITTLVYINFHNVQIRQSANFKALRKDMDRIKRSQSAIINNLYVPKKVDVAPANYTGTGFALTNNGYFITSLHVINGADSVFIQNQALQEFKAITVFKDEQMDIAILKVVSADFKPFSSLPYSFSDKQGNLGEHVYTLGFPREDMVYGEGALSAASGFEGDTTSYQISIPLNPGNSGGPLIDDKGNVIGLITGIQTETEGAAFAVKSKHILAILNDMPQDSITSDLKLTKRNTLLGCTRVNQIKMIKEYIVNVKVYNEQ